MQDEPDDWYKSILNAMHDMVLVKGAQSRVLWANRAFLNYYGMTETQLRDIVDAEHSDPDDTLQYVIDDQTVFDTGRVLDVRSEAVTDASGNSRDFHTIKSPILEDGCVMQTVGVSRLIDDGLIQRRKVSHADAKNYVAPLKSLTGNFPLPMMMVDTTMRIVNASPLWGSSFGEVELTPNTAFEDAYPDLGAMRALIRNCLAKRHPAETTISSLTPGGAEKTYSVQVSPWSFPDGTFGGATVVATDVTALHEESASLQKANDELVQFSYRASHDLKGPLSTVKGLAEFIVLDIEDGELDEAKDNGRQIQKMMHNLEETVISILALTRADLKEEQTSTVDLSKMLAEICDGLAFQVSASDIAIRVDLQVASLRLEAARLRQILENLISNAIKYRSNERDQSFIQVHSRLTNGAVEISVEDNGLGIPAGARDKVFEMFSRFHTEFEGSGLGLAIVRKHVDALGGSISVDATAHGTIFRLRLPQDCLGAAA